MTENKDLVAASLTVVTGENTAIMLDRTKSLFDKMNKFVEHAEWFSIQQLPGRQILNETFSPKKGIVFLECPEAGISIRCIGIVAGNIIRLVRDGSMVIVITHSDILIQHINNAIKAGTLSKNQTAVYDVDANGDFTSCPCGAYGYEVKSHYNALQAVCNTARALDDMI